jgi:hypothetical protein
MARTECGDEQEQRGSGQGCSAVSEKAVWHNAAPGRRAALSSRAHKASPVRPFEEFNKAISDDGWITQPAGACGWLAPGFASRTRVATRVFASNPDIAAFHMLFRPGTMRGPDLGDK